MTTIREELMEATSLKPKKKEDESEFISRLSGAVEDLDEDVWDKLSTEAQEFHNTVALAKKNDQDIPPFPDETSENGDEGTDDEPAEETEEDGDAEDGEETMAKDEDDEDIPKKKPAAKSVKKPEKTPAKGKAAAEKEKPTKAAKSKGNGESKTPSMRRRLKQIIIKKPSIGVDDLIERLSKEGFKPSKMTVGSIRADTRDTMKVLVDAGLLEIEM